jgi:hypothetical protein
MTEVIRLIKGSKVEPTQDLLKELFYYKDGKLFNRIQRGSKALVGEEAGCLHNRGYRHIKINGNIYLSHRLIYIYHNGEIADKLYTDHIDRIKSNNNIENLRLVTGQENQFNTDAKGYCFHKASNKFLARIRLNGKLINLGLFNTEDEARDAYLKAKKELHKIEEKIKGV